ncbi:MAG: hypothetical protein JOY82_08150 [Streptosporangiaceae bacterium]|nr:hypothetical protein [Streptosporangiaceae bacterium]MBV9854485.1 hypothetical protein [Streptosporangiaceae bacterium]
MNIDGPDLEDRYRRVLRLLPGYYRDRWEEDMVAAFLNSQMTGDEDEDDYISGAAPRTARGRRLLPARTAG